MKSKIIFCGTGGKKTLFPPSVTVTGEDRLSLTSLRVESPMTLAHGSIIRASTVLGRKEEKKNMHEKTSPSRMRIFFLKYAENRRRIKRGEVREWEW